MTSVASGQSGEAFKTHVDSLMELHALSVVGKSQTVEAQPLRDILEGSWVGLSELDRSLVEGLSEDLHWIQHENPGRAVKEPNPQFRDALMKHMQPRELAERTKWLDVLRRWQDYIQPPHLSHFRASCWMDIGNPRVAAEFYLHSAKMGGGVDEEGIAISALMNEDVHRAAVIAKHILTKLDTKPSLSTLYLAFAALFVEDNSPTSCLHLAAQMRDAVPARVVVGELPAAANLFALQARCEMANRNDAKALDLCRKAAALMPNDPALLAELGNALTLNRLDATEVYRRALELGSRSGIACLKVAARELAAGNFGKAFRIAERGLDADKIQPTVEGFLHFIQILSHAAQGVPSDQLEPQLAKAIECDPDSEALAGFQEEVRKCLGQKVSQWNIEVILSENLSNSIQRNPNSISAYKPMLPLAA